MTMRRNFASLDRPYWIKKFHSIKTFFFHQNVGCSVAWFDRGQIVFWMTGWHFCLQLRGWSWKIYIFMLLPEPDPAPFYFSFFLSLFHFPSLTSIYLSIFFYLSSPVIIVTSIMFSFFLSLSF